MTRRVAERSHALRPHRHRHRPRRLCLRHPRGAAGLKAAVVEKRATFGGTCLNVGCIPSKALLHASELFEEAGHSFSKMGIGVGTPKLDLAAMMTYKDEGVDGNVKGVEFLLKKNKVDAFQGVGSIAGPARSRSPAPTARRRRSRRRTSSSPPAPMSRACRASTSTRSASSPRPARSSSTSVPERLLVVGAGVIGLELGSVWRRLGAQVTVVEFLDRILPGMDGEVARQSQRILEKQGIAFKLSSKVTGVDSSGTRLKVTRRAARRRCGGDHRGRRRAGRHRPRALHRRARPRKRSASSSTSAAASRSTSISPPTSPASTPSAT